MKAFITIQPETRGIQYVEIEPTLDESVVTFLDTSGYRQYAHGAGREWHTAWETALARAATCTEAKRTSLTKQLAKLDSVVFLNPSL